MILRRYLYTNLPIIILKIDNINQHKNSSVLIFLLRVFNNLTFNNFLHLSYIKRKILLKLSIKLHLFKQY